MSLFAGAYVSGGCKTSLEFTSSDDLSSAARCQPYSSYDRGAKHKVGLILLSIKFLMFGRYIVVMLNVSVRIPGCDFHLAWHPVNLVQD